jgi:exonuclease III
MSCDGAHRGCGPEEEVLRVGTWNISDWTVPKATVVATEVGAHVLALQETHLSSLTLERAHTSARALGLHLHHGRPVWTARGESFGRSCGVGFVTMQGVAVTPVLPVGAAWRQLHAVGRLHAVRLAPRPALPRGLLLLSIYAPLQPQTAERVRFNRALLEVTHTLDLQTPTLLLSDFNGSICPPRDYLGSTGRSRAACALLTQLLGPGAAWVDVHAALLPAPLPWTFQSVDTRNRLSASRIDLILVNQAALPLVDSASVLSSVRDGGHSPVLLSLRLGSATGINWRRPVPRLPPLLRLPSAELSASPDWTALLDTWSTSIPVQRVLSPDASETLDSLSRCLREALLHLVTLAGGWVVRPPHRRLAYDSDALRSVRRRLAALYRLDTLIRRATPSGPGCWPTSWSRLLDQLRSSGLHLSATSIPSLHLAVAAAVQDHRAEIARLNREMRVDPGWRRPGGTDRASSTTGSRRPGLRGAPCRSSTRLACSAPPSAPWCGSGPRCCSSSSWGRPPWGSARSLGRCT